MLQGMVDTSYHSDDLSRLTTEALLREVARLEDLINVRFSSADQINRERWSAIEKQFAIIEEQRREQKQDTKEAVDAALVAQQKAVEKTEIAVSKQLDQLSNTFAVERSADRDSITDLKERIVGLEQQKAGVRTLLATASTVAGFVLALGLIYGIVSSLP